MRVEARVELGKEVTVYKSLISVFIFVRLTLGSNILHLKIV